MTTSYFIAPDARNEDQIWRDGAEFPVPVLAQRSLQHDPDVWGLLVAAIPRRTR